MIAGYVGLDDTDVVGAGGTGQLARSLALVLQAGLPGLQLEGVSRHQLLQGHPRVPCTRRSRCSCIVARGRAHILQRSVKGSDPELLEEARIGNEIRRPDRGGE